MGRPWSGKISLESLPTEDEKIRNLVRFAESYMGSVVRHQMSGVKGQVIDWHLGKKLNGVWLMTDAGTEVYRQYVRR